LIRIFETANAPFGSARSPADVSIPKTKFQSEGSRTLRRAQRPIVSVPVAQILKLRLETRASARLESNAGSSSLFRVISHRAGTVPMRSPVLSAGRRGENTISMHRDRGGSQ
jgi:hypothetical protein